MKCPNCGSESNGNFCVYCGAPMPQADSSQNAGQTPPDQQAGDGSQTYYQENSWQQNYQQDAYQQSWQQQNSYQQDSRQAGGYQQNYRQQAPYSQGTPDIPPEYRPISMWGYFGYELLFSIPCVGFILLLIFSFGGTQNVNLKNFARSYFCLLIIAVVLFLVLAGTPGGFAMFPSW